MQEEGDLWAADMIRDVKDLSPEQKMAVESCWPCIGARDREHSGIRTARPIPSRRQEIAEELRKCFAEVDVNRLPVSAEEADEIINERCAAADRGYRPRP